MTMNLENVESWQIAFVGLIVSIIQFVIYFASIMLPCEGNCMLVLSFVAIITIATVLPISLSALLLAIDKTKKDGAALSVVFGAIGLLTSTATFHSVIFGTLILPSIFLIAAGIRYFQKENSDEYRSMHSKNKDELSFQ